MGGIFRTFPVEEKQGPEVPPTVTGDLGCWCVGPKGDDPVCPCRMRTLGLEASSISKHVDIVGEKP